MMVAKQPDNMAEQLYLFVLFLTLIWKVDAFSYGVGNPVHHNWQ